METEEKLISDLIKIGFVDLGLSVQWAMCNVGAHNPKDNGNYYDFDEAQKFTYLGCRLPTSQEFQELLDNCDYRWTEMNGVNGRLFTSKKNGNSIFFPAAGDRGPKGMDGVGGYGGYWSSTAGDWAGFDVDGCWSSMADEDNSACSLFFRNYNTAFCLFFHNDFAEIGSYFCKIGQSVRLVHSL